MRPTAPSAMLQAMWLPTFISGDHARDLEGLLHNHPTLGVSVVQHRIISVRNCVWCMGFKLTVGLKTTEQIKGCVTLDESCHPFLI